MLCSSSDEGVGNERRGSNQGQHWREAAAGMGARMNPPRRPIAERHLASLWATIRDAIEVVEVGPGDALQIEVSYGIAAVHPDANDGEGSQLLAQADARLRSSPR